MSENEARAKEPSKERIASHQGLALDLSRAGCGCDDDATDGCPNWNGERCTFAEFMIAKAIATAEVYAEQRGKRDGLIAAKSVVIEHGWNPYLGAMCADIDARLAALDADIRKAGEGA